MMTARNSTALSNGSNNILIEFGPSEIALTIQLERYNSQKRFADDPSQDDREGNDEESVDNTPNQRPPEKGTFVDPETYAI
jgi:hypothetical protein